jgi:hypothetical protein
MDSYLSIKAGKTGKILSISTPSCTLKGKAIMDNVLLESFQKPAMPSQLKSQQNGLLFFSNTPFNREYLRVTFVSKFSQSKI